MTPHQTASTDLGPLPQKGTSMRAQPTELIDRKGNEAAVHPIRQRQSREAVGMKLVVLRADNSSPSDRGKAALSSVILGEGGGHHNIHAVGRTTARGLDINIRWPSKVARAP